MKLSIAPNKSLQGSVTLPGDKSISHRAALFAALARGESRIENFLDAGVTRVLLESLKGLGIDWQLEGTSLKVTGKGLGGFTTPPHPLNCGNSATTMRLMIGALTAANVSAQLDGSDGLRRRPMGRVIEPLQQMGADLDAAEGGTAPLQVKSRPDGQVLHGIHYKMPVASAQVKTAILLAALAADSPTTVQEPGPSRDHTERMLASMGAQVETTAGSNPKVRLTPQSSSDLRPLSLTIPGDFSSAAFLIVAAIITPGSEITLHEVGLNPTRTGLLDALLRMGADIKVCNRGEQQGEPVGDITIKASQMKGICVDGLLVVRMIDEFPIFAVAASQAQGQTAVRDACELRHKESDRIQAICFMLGEQGVDITETDDGFVIYGRGDFKGGYLQAGGDHRLAMSMAVAGLAAKKRMVIEGAEIIHESYPEFSDTLNRLGAEVRNE